MNIDVIDLKHFYETPLGRYATRVMATALKSLWTGSLEGEKILGLGYALPLLNVMGDQPERTLAFMPKEQGVIHWPLERPNKTALVDDAALPLADQSMDKIVLMHALENTRDGARVLRECWRVLKDSGSLVIVVPNRRGFWSGSDNTPFGRGQPFSRSQIIKSMRDALFTPVTIEPLIYVPPLQSRLMLSLSFTWEWLGESVFSNFAGLLMIQVRKQVYGLSGTAEPAIKKSRSTTPKLQPAMS